MIMQQPEAPLDHQQRMNRRLAAVRHLLQRQQLEYARQIQSLREEHQLPASELAENADYIRLTVDLPGVLARDVQVKVEHGVLAIVATRKHMSIDGSSCLKAHEISRGYAVNSTVVDIDKLEAKLESGVLIIKAPKKARHLDPVQVDVASAATAPEEVSASVTTRTRAADQEEVSPQNSERSQAHARSFDLTQAVDPHSAPAESEGSCEGRTSKRVRRVSDEKNSK